MRHVVIGASAAGIKAAALLRGFDKEAEITLISQDTQVYSRCMLHLKLAGQRDDERLSFVDQDFFAANRIAWMSGETVSEVLPSIHAVHLESGKVVPYDKLLIASGASSFIPPVPNLRGAANVMALRTIDDVRHLASWGNPGARAVIVGAGLVGVDAAVGLMERGVKVTLVEMADRVLAIQLDEYAASQYDRLLREHGAEVVVGARVKSAVLNGEGGVSAVELEDGRKLPCDFCVVAAGVAPNIGFVKGSLGLTENGRALKVDRRCQTSAPDVYAAGDVTFLAPIWPEAVRQAEVAATNMAGYDASLPERDWALTNSMNFFGLPTISYGRTGLDDPSYTYDTYIDGDVYRKVIHQDGAIHGAVFQGDVDNCGVYLRLIRDAIPFEETGKDALHLSYADFFQQAANGEFV